MVTRARRAETRGRHPTKEVVMKSVMMVVLAAAATCAAPAFAALGDDFDKALNNCIEGAKQRQEGVLTAWSMKRSTETTEIELTILTPDNQRVSMKCVNGAPSDFGKKFSGKNYEMLSNRKNVSELAARTTAEGVYNEATPHKMELELDLMGHPYYHYELTTADGGKATVVVNAQTGQVESSKMKKG
ncbi:MAG: hypothetical protein C5B46_08950 [Proteobacteria bacterium]|nr:MAG: hypothetical protein C5B46_08950 [Pseudomonadota bacterium]